MAATRITAVTAAVELALVLGLAAPAHAATVRVHDDCSDNGCLYDASFVAAPGERNDVTAVHDGTNVVVVRDAGAPLTPGTGCVALDAHGARCAAADIELALSLRDGDDRLSGGDVRLIGGPGADDLRASRTGSFLDDDGAHPARDRYTGGSGTDTVSYDGRRHGW